MNDIQRWEDEGGSLIRPWSEMSQLAKENFVWNLLSNSFPKIEFVDMDHSIFWKSLTPYYEGDTIKHEGTTYRVLYGWHWTTYGPFPVYMAELQVETK